MTPLIKAAIRKRGRPRKKSTTVVSVRIPNDALDAYCRIALRSGQDLRTVLRHVLTNHAPAA